MATKTVEELRNSVLAYDFAPNKYTSFINSWIDEAQRYMFRRAGLRNKETTEKYSTVSGTKELTLPSNFGSVRSLYLENKPNENLRQIFDIKIFDELEEEKSEPNSYIIHNNFIYLYPTPNSIYTIILRYNVSPSSIAEENSAMPSVGEEFIYLIEEYCLYKAFGKEQDIEMANYHKGLFDTGLVEFCGYITGSTQDDVEQVNGSWNHSQMGWGRW